MTGEQKIEKLVGETEPGKKNHFYIPFRKIFDKLPERETLLKTLVEMNSEFSPAFFGGDISTEEEIKDTIMAIEGLSNAMGKGEKEPLYEEIIKYKKIQAFFKVVCKKLKELAE